MKNQHKILGLLFLLVSCASGNKTAEKIKSAPTDFTIAFGSCNKQQEPQPLWSAILSNNPDVYIWGGDNIYADTKDMAILQSAYEVQLNNQGYKKLKESVPVMGTWDDHDYGINDGGKNWEFKDKSQDLFLDFFDVPKSNERRNRQGVYHAETFKLKKGVVKVIMLDTRYFRSPLLKSENPNKRYKESNGTILGDKQWTWLKSELQNSKADFNIVVSSIQVLSQEHGFEKWANFPQERARLLNLIQGSKARNVVILSGDRHISEFSQMNVPGVTFPIIDFTSSGLTHTYEEFDGEPNQFRVGEVVNDKSFGLLKFNFNKNKLTLEMRGLDNKLLQEYSQTF